MEFTFRTLLRAFLLVGGIGIAVMGALDGSSLDIAIGTVAAVLGGGGLLYQWRKGQESEIEPADAAESGDETRDGQRDNDGIDT